jgi:bifunctional DNase/RNase
MPVRMELSRILIRELTDVQLIELTEAEPANGAAPRSFPIVIGLPEAQAIERRLSGLIPKRPQTHDLLASVVATLGARLDSVEITGLSEGTFYARLNLTGADGSTVQVDARPSDAIALGVASGVPVLVEESVIEEAAPPQNGELEL